MKEPTEFVKAVVLYLAQYTQGQDAYAVRTHLMDMGFGKHPAAVAMHLTKLAWKSEYVTGYVYHEERVFMLTSEGRELAERLKKP